MKTSKNILFVHYGDNWIRGSERCLIDAVNNIDKNRFTPFVWTNNRALYQQMRDNNISAKHSRFTLLFGWTKPKFALFNWFKLLYLAGTLIRTHNIELIHVNSGAPCQWMWLISRLFNIPMLLHLHSDYPLRDRSTLGFHLSPHIITVSHAVSKQLLKDGYSSERLTVIHNGIETVPKTPTCKMSVKQHLGLNEDCFLMVTVGSLIKRKGIDLLIQATKQLISNDPNIHLLIIGDGPEHSSLIALAKQLNIAGNIHFAGEQTNVMSWLNSDADVFVSGAQSEAFGLVIAEAALAGLAIVAPHTGGIPEIVSHKKSALLYSKRDATTIAAHISLLKQSSSFKLTLGMNARRRVQTAFSLQHYINALETTYDSSLSSPLHFPPFLKVCTQQVGLIAKALLHLHRSSRSTLMPTLSANSHSDTQIENSPSKT